MLVRPASGIATPTLQRLIRGAKQTLSYRPLNVRNGVVCRWTALPPDSRRSAWGDKRVPLATHTAGMGWRADMTIPVPASRASPAGHFLTRPYALWGEDQTTAWQTSPVPTRQGHTRSFQCASLLPLPLHLVYQDCRRLTAHLLIRLSVWA